jgi:sugar phosphate isomerase/epimerase
MLRPHVALQTFTIRKELRTLKSREIALKKVKSLGLNNLELARIHFSPPVIKEVSSVCKTLDLRIVSTQMKLRELTTDLEWTVQLHKELNCQRCSVSVVSFRHLRQGRRGLEAYAEELNRVGQALKNNGITLLYHHHNYEFVPIGESDGFEILLDRIDPASVKLVLDTYWLQRSGHSPEAVIHRLAGRVEGIHLRDFKPSPPVWNPGITDTEIGRGNLDFTRITTACAETGVTYMAIEQSTETPWHSIEVSINYLKSIGLSDNF